MSIIVGDSSKLVDMLNIMLAEDMSMSEALLYCRWDASFGEDTRVARDNIIAVISQHTQNITEWNCAIDILDILVMPEPT